MTLRTLIRGGTVLVGDPRRAGFQVADVMIENGVITRIGPDLPADGDTTVLNSTGQLVVPGFVDTHHHLWQTTLRGVAAEWSIVDFLWGMRMHHAPIHTPEDVYAGTYAGAVAALDAGVTTTIDHLHAANSPEHATQSMAALRDAGIRAQWAFGPSATDETAFNEGRLGYLDGLLESGAGSGSALVEIGLAASDLGSIPWDESVQEFKFAAARKIPLTVHARSFQGPGMPNEIAWLHQAGLLGPHQSTRT